MAAKLQSVICQLKPGYRNIMLWLILLVVALQAGDGILTFAAVSRKLVREGNPFMQSIAGSGEFVVMKITGALMCALMLWLIYRRFPRVSVAATASIVLFYAGVLSWNLSILL
jgi:hypothetical protein